LWPKSTNSSYVLIREIHLSIQISWNAVFNRCGKESGERPRGETSDHGDKKPRTLSFDVALPSSHHHPDSNPSSCVSYPNTIRSYDRPTTCRTQSLRYNWNTVK
jgi:hypothetical protein